MSAPALLPNSYLVAILLVCHTRTGSGAQVVFHHPQNPLSGSSVVSGDGLETTLDSGESSIEDSEEWSTDDEYFNGAQVLPNASGTKPKSRDTGRADDGSEVRRYDREGDLSSRISRTLFGFDLDGLVSLLSPDRSWHKRKFELSINNLTFIGRPVFSKTDGTWRKDKRSKKRAEKSENSETESQTDEDRDQDQRAKESVAALSNDEQARKSPLMMFHVIFVMNPPALEHTQRVRDMYENVAKKFSRALKWEQTHHDYVWKEIDEMLQIASQSQRYHTDPMFAQKVLEKSSLATAIANLYTSISASRIASISLSPGFSVSLQIPPTTSTSYLPSLTEPPLQPGLWLTTATGTLESDREHETQSVGSTIQLAKTYTLLLKSPPHRIAKDVQAAGGSLASHLPKFVAALRPTKSFYKLSNTAQISLADIQFLARHLIYWRRAIAIPPLHQRDTYILSPNADLSKIKEACKSYEAQFPASLPAFPKLLSELSGIPRPFGTLIPSPDHKDIYMLVLAWLLRNGWVTQLRTFGFVRVDPNTKRMADEQKRDLESKTTTFDEQNQNSEVTGSLEEHKGVRPRSSFISRRSSEGRRSIDVGRNMRASRSASLITSPPRASLEESHWLECIAETLLHEDYARLGLSQEEKMELQHHWPTLLKHLNGTSALETVSVRENIKRKHLWEILSKLGVNFEQGIEDEEGKNRRLIVAFRHW